MGARKIKAMTSLPTFLRATVFSLMALATAGAAYAQTASPSDQSSVATPEASAARKWSVSWGWNRSTYSNSDIHFWGADHDFTIRNVVATDIQTDASLGNIFGIYLRPSEVTIPQTNFRVAYQLSTDTAIAVNLDHMKYVMLADQTVPISGRIGNTTYPPGSSRVMDVNFLNFEHTDGLNIVSLEMEKQYPLNWFGSANPSRAFVLAGLGFVLPKSNVTLNMLGRARNDEFHLAGYSFGAGAGVEVDFWKNFFSRANYKLGYVNLPDVVTSSQGDKASHSFTYNELAVYFGWRF
jgi:opacity protein-like surface antigen